MVIIYTYVYSPSPLPLSYNLFVPLKVVNICSYSLTFSTFFCSLLSCLTYRPNALRPLLGREGEGKRGKGEGEEGRGKGERGKGKGRRGGEGGKKGGMGRFNH